jgi:hypothetical protein
MEPETVVFTLHGKRVPVTDDTGRVVITDTNGADISLQFPEVRGIGRELGHREVTLAGVIVPVGSSGELLGDRSGLDRWLRVRSDSGARNASRTGSGRDRHRRQTSRLAVRHRLDLSRPAP